MQVKKGWHIWRVRRYIRKIDTFLKLLLFMVYTIVGQPARGTKIILCWYQNRLLQDWNVFIIDRQVVFITRYYKLQSLINAPKVIPRFLPQRVGQLVALYLAYVLPFQERLIEYIQRRKQSDYIQASKYRAQETDRLIQVIKARSLQALRNKLYTLNYQHIAIAIRQVFIDEIFRVGT